MRHGFGYAKPMNKKHKGRASEILAANLQAKMLARYSSKPSTNARITALMKESGVGKRTIQRMLMGSENSTIGTIEDVAKALRCEVHELLMEPPPDNE